MTGLINSAKSLQSFVSHHVSKLLGKNQGELVARDVDKMKLFGFGKVAVSLCFSSELERYTLVIVMLVLMLNF